MDTTARQAVETAKASAKKKQLLASSKSAFSKGELSAFGAAR